MGHATDIPAGRLRDLAQRNQLTEEEARTAMRIMSDGTASANGIAREGKQTPEQALRTLQKIAATGLIGNAGLEGRPDQDTPWYLTELGETEARQTLAE